MYTLARRAIQTMKYLCRAVMATLLVLSSYLAQIDPHTHVYKQIDIKKSVSYIYEVTLLAIYITHTYVYKQIYNKNLYHTCMT